MRSHSRAPRPDAGSCRSGKTPGHRHLAARRRARRARSTGTCCAARTRATWQRWRNEIQMLASTLIRSIRRARVAGRAPVTGAAGSGAAAALADVGAARVVPHRALRRGTRQAISCAGSAAVRAGQAADALPADCSATISRMRTNVDAVAVAAPRSTATTTFDAFASALVATRPSLRARRHGVSRCVAARRQRPWRSRDVRALRASVAVRALASRWRAPGFSVPTAD